MNVYTCCENLWADQVSILNSCIYPSTSLKSQYCTIKLRRKIWYKSTIIKKEMGKKCQTGNAIKLPEDGKRMEISANETK